jgi:neural Wiskott-Aldrich syndrome protein
MLAGIRASGGIGGGRLKKVDPSQKRDRSAAIVPGNVTSPSEGRASPAPTGADTGLAGALQAALNKRKTRVSQSGKITSHSHR